MTALPPLDVMERAYLEKDESYDGIFFLAVRTTGIFCRPSCSARKPLPENVEYFATTKEALFAGYRPCKRCHPLEVNGALPAWADQLLHDIEESPTLRIKDADLEERGLNPATVRRFFEKRFGMTFQAYARARRLGKAFEAIRHGGDLDDAALDYGFESFSGFREAFGKLFGQPPGKSRNSDCMMVDWVESPMGPLVAAATSEAVCMLEFTDRRMLEAQFTTLQKRFQRAIVPGTNKHLAQLKQELALYFEGKLQTFSVPLTYLGTPFQEKVWTGLLTIPYGETRTYQELANELGVPNGQRAVGRANGQNRIAIVIPCHRVINEHGELSGYGGGLWRKRLLLNLERGEAIQTPVETEQLSLL
jgi:AraC family transcriptional regulator of adaptative response/methylated-DNA-[protein]-cysteine methyltransferase